MASRAGEASAQHVSTGWRRIGRVVGLVVGALLLAAAVAVAARGVDWSVLGAASPWAVAALVGAGALNLALTGGLFWAITRCFDARPAVGYWRMTALLAASGLLNYLPLVRPGLLGRAVYLKAKHELPLRQSVVILGVVMVLAVAVLGTVGLLMLVLPGGWRWGAALAAVLVLTVLTRPLGGRLLGRVVPTWGWWAPLRTVDLAVSAGRLWLAFEVMGAPIGYGDAVVAASASLLVKLAGLTPNGLGLSEWAVAALSSALAPVSTATGAAAALLDRAAEAVVLIVAGSISAWWLRK